MSSSKRKGKSLSANELLTFQQFTPTYRDIAEPTKETAYVPYDEPVWQTAVRIYMNRDSPAEDDLECPSNLDWSRVALVDVFSAKLTHCPICLDNVFKCPRITYCGHVFCFPCIIRYIQMTAGQATCPMCSDLVSVCELKAVRVQRAVSARNRGVFVLSKRMKHTNVIRWPSAGGVWASSNYLQKLQFVYDPTTSKRPPPPVEEPWCLVVRPEDVLCHQVFHLYAAQLVPHLVHESALELCTEILETEASLYPGVTLEDHVPEFFEKIAHVSLEGNDSALNEMVETCRPDVPMEKWEEYVNGARDSWVEVGDIEDDGVVMVGTSVAVKSTYEKIRKLPCYLTYQMWDGQLHFLTSDNVRVLFYESGMDVSRMALVTPCLRLLWPTEVTVSAATNTRYSFLSNLPKGSAVCLHDVDLRPYLSPDTNHAFKEFFRERRRRIAMQLERKDRKDRLYHEYVQKSFSNQP